MDLNSRPEGRPLADEVPWVRTASLQPRTQIGGLHAEGDGRRFGRTEGGLGLHADCEQSRREGSARRPG